MSLLKSHMAPFSHSNSIFSLKAIVFRPFKGEVLEAVVTQVNKVCLQFHVVSKGNYIQAEDK